MPANLTPRERDRWNIYRQLRLRLVKALNVVLMTLPFAAVWYQYYGPRIRMPFYFWGNIAVIGLYAAFYGIFGGIYSAFLISLCRISELIYSQMLAAVISGVFQYVILALLSAKPVRLSPMLAVLAMQLLGSTLWCWGSNRWYFHSFPPVKTVVVWDRRGGELLNNMIRQYGLHERFKVTSMPTVEDCIEHKETVLEGAQAVFLCGVHSHERNILTKYCIEKGIIAYVIPRVGDTIMESAQPIHMLHLPMLRVERYNPSPFYLFVKRIFDILGSLLGLIILSPVMLAIAVAITLDDGGPVLYRQRRFTKDHRRFFILKFRSMRTDAEQDGVARLSTGEDDPRLTRVGRFLRAHRLDEIPQLINILEGDMSFVGPRPERPELAHAYEKVMPEFALRLQAKAGLTGYAQVFGRYNTDPYDKLLMDMQYIAHPSLAQDLKILFATAKILILPERVKLPETETQKQEIFAKAPQQ